MDAHFGLDALTCSADETEEYTCTTLGYIVSQNDRWIAVAGEVTPEGFRAVSHIPMMLVHRISPLGKVEPNYSITGGTA